VTRERPQQTHSAKTHLTTLVLARGYRNFDVIGPFITRQDIQHYVVTIYAGDNAALHTLRGTFEELREQIAAVPRR